MHSTEGAFESRLIVIIARVEASVVTDVHNRLRLLVVDSTNVNALQQYKGIN